MGAAGQRERVLGQARRPLPQAEQPPADGAWVRGLGPARRPGLGLAESGRWRPARPLVGLAGVWLGQRLPAAGCRPCRPEGHLLARPPPPPCGPGRQEKGRGAAGLLRVPGRWRGAEVRASCPCPVPALPSRPWAAHGVSCRCCGRGWRRAHAMAPAGRWEGGCEWLLCASEERESPSPAGQREGTSRFSGGSAGEGVGQQGGRAEFPHRSVSIFFLNEVKTPCNCKDVLNLFMDVLAGNVIF